MKIAVAILHMQPFAAGMFDSSSKTFSPAFAPAARGGFIYDHPDWPNFIWDNEAVSPIVCRIRYRQGFLSGRLKSLGFSTDNALLDALTLDVEANHAIEGEKLEKAQIRSSLARRLGFVDLAPVNVARNVDAAVEVMLDATKNYHLPLSHERLFAWHAMLFPSGYSGVQPITVGAWRRDENGPMRIVSGAIGNETIHYQAPASDRLPAEMRRFLEWLNAKTAPSAADPVLRAGIAHLWFVMVHPFDDGNGRIARTISDMLLARSENNSQRFYSVSAQILEERKAYYSALEMNQVNLKTAVESGSLAEPVAASALSSFVRRTEGCAFTKALSAATATCSRNTSPPTAVFRLRGVDITAWLVWFLSCVERSIIKAEDTLSAVLQKAEFWKRYANTSFNERQRKMLNKLLDGFEGKLKTSKWAKITHCAQFTALRDIQDLIAKGILQEEAGGGRSTSYALKPCTHEQRHSFMECGAQPARDR